MVPISISNFGASSEPVIVSGHDDFAALAKAGKLVDAVDTRRHPLCSDDRTPPQIHRSIEADPAAQDGAQVTSLDNEVVCCGRATRDHQRGAELLEPRVLSVAFRKAERTVDRSEQREVMKHAV